MSKNAYNFTYDSEGRLVDVNGSVTFFYDHAGVAGFKFDSQYYTYRKDAQGNIIAILDKRGNVVVEYNYDAWGINTIVDGSDMLLATLNPFRYRGYYYDTETGLYYLKTRYYDPTLGRFMTIDGIEYLDPESINGLNLYAYCNNNPVMYVDPNGNKWWHWVVAAVAVVGITVATVFTAGGAALAIGTALGVGNALVGATMVGAAIGGLAAGGMELISQGLATNWGRVDWGALAIETFTGAAYGAATGMMGATTSVGLRVGLRGAMVAVSGVNAALHGVNSGQSFKETMMDIGVSMGTAILLQSFFVGIDARRGMLSSAVLESYKLDGFLFMFKDKLFLGGTSALKNFLRNRDKLFKVDFV